MTKEEDMEEMRSDMLEEARRDEHHEIDMGSDYDYFLDHCGVHDIQEELHNIRQLCDEYGYDFNEVLDS